MKLNPEQLREILPHREPFLLPDRVTACEPGVFADAVMRADEDAFFFRGHFPGNPVMPGIMILEALAQTAAVILLTLEEYRGRTVLLAGVRNAKFLKSVVPGDTLVLHTEIKKRLGDLGSVRAEARVNGEICAEAELSFAVAGDQSSAETR